MKDKYMEIARQEIAVMQVLQAEPCSRGELQHKLGIEPRRLEHVLSGLKQVKYVYRVPGTHLLAMT